jgi:hypothetical protein
MAASLRAMLRKFDRPLQSSLFTKHNSSDPTVTSSRESNRLVGQPLLAFRVSPAVAALDSQEWLSYKPSGLDTRRVGYQNVLHGTFLLDF